LKIPFFIKTPAAAAGTRISSRKAGYGFGVKKFFPKSTVELLRKKKHIIKKTWKALRFIFKKLKTFRFLGGMSASFIQNNFENLQNVVTKEIFFFRF
jgi:hypothetical protein